MTLNEALKERKTPTFTVIQGGKMKVVENHPVQAERFGKELMEFVQQRRESGKA